MACKKTKKKNKKKIDLYKLFHGFTLVELLAVIVILAIIMIIAIPSVLNTLETSRRKTFWEYVNKVYSAAQTQWTKDTTMNPDFYKGEGIYIYDIKKDLGFNSTGSFGGYVAVFNYVYTNWDGSKIGNIQTEFDITLINDNYFTGINVTLEGLPDDAIVQDIGDESKYNTPKYLHYWNTVGNSYILDRSFVEKSIGGAGILDKWNKKMFACVVNKSHWGLSHMTADSTLDVFSFNVYDAKDTSTPLEVITSESDTGASECIAYFE